MAVLGNLKFDLQVDAAQVEAGRALRAQWPQAIVLLASSREGEEVAWVQALAQHPADFLPCVVPRHPQRFDEVAALLHDAGWQVLRRSRWPEDPQALVQAGLSPRTVLLGDTLGEMPFYYALARLALMGGSFGRYGGQNLIEALACACPVILGPHTYNFGQASEDAIEAQAAARVQDMAQGVALAARWCAQTDVTQAMSARGLTLLQGHRGAAERMALALVALITSKDC